MAREMQAIGCLQCGAAESIYSDSLGLSPGQWPAWTPGLQGFPCPECGVFEVWATDTREVENEELRQILEGKT